MPEEIVTLVRMSISELVEELRKRHRIQDPLGDVRLEEDSLTFYFLKPTKSVVGPRTDAIGRQGSTVTAEVSQIALDRDAPVVKGKRRRRARKKRNRMRTRGWPIVSKMKNIKGQTVVIYKPFVEALGSLNLSRTEMKGVVAKILRENGNRPSEASIDYFLENTLEYLKQKRVENSA